MAASKHSYCGFDFGTSNSSIGRIVDGHPTLVPIEGEGVTIPTALFFGFAEQEVLFGKAAIGAYMQGEEGRLMRSLKSVLGTSLMRETTQIRSQRLSFEEIISTFISLMREGSGHCTSVLMGRPVFFVDDDDEADREAQAQLAAAAKAAGFKHIEFQFEPIAAALEYESHVTKEELVFVADIGGGTSDFSIVRVSPDRRGKPDRQTDILACDGVHIGGTDFDRYLSLSKIMPELGLRSKLINKGMETPVWWYQDLSTWQRIALMYDRRVITDIKRVRRDSAEQAKFDALLSVLESRSGHEVLGRVENAKILLSKMDTTTITIPGHASKPPLQVTRKEFEHTIEKAIGRIKKQIFETLKQADLPAGTIDAVFLTGGSSELVLLRQTLSDIFPGRSTVEGDTFGSVSMGLTIEAHDRFGS